MKRLALAALAACSALIAPLAAHAVPLTRFGIICTYRGCPVTPNAASALFGTSFQRLHMPVSVFLTNLRTGNKWPPVQDIDPADAVLANRSTWKFGGVADFTVGDTVTSPCFPGLTATVLSTGVGGVVLDTPCTTYVTENVTGQLGQQFDKLDNWLITTNGGYGAQWQAENRITQGNQGGTATGSISGNTLTLTAFTPTAVANDVPQVLNTVSGAGIPLVGVSGGQPIVGTTTEWNGTTGVYTIGGPLLSIPSETITINPAPKYGPVAIQTDWTAELEFTYQQIRAQGSPDPVLIAFGNEVNNNSDEAATAAQYLTDLKTLCTWAHTHAIKCTDSGATSPSSSLIYWRHLFFLPDRVTPADAAHQAAADRFALAAFPQGSNAAVLGDLPNACQPNAGVLVQPSHADKLVNLIKGEAILDGEVAAGVDYINVHWFQDPPPWGEEEKVNWLKSLIPSHMVVFNALGQYSASGGDLVQEMNEAKATGAPFIEWFSNDGVRAVGLWTVNNTPDVDGIGFQAVVAGTVANPVLPIPPAFYKCNNAQ